MSYLKAFIAGFIATLVFHQGLFGLLYIAGATPVAPFDLTPTEPLGIPAVLSLAFWGGVWGLPLWLVIKQFGNLGYWSLAALLGAIGPSAVAMLVVFPQKGLAVDEKIIVGALMLNAAWGIGVAVLMRVMHKDAA